MNIQLKYESLSGINFNPTSINIPNDFTGLQSIEEFQYKFQNKNWKIAHKYVRMYDFLMRIKERYSNWLDPIKYLYYLYYKIKLSTNDIQNELWYLWNYVGKWTIQKMLKDRFWWNLRKANHKENHTKLRNEKDRNKIKPLNNIQKNLKQDNVEKVERILNIFSKNKPTKKFSRETFSNLKNVRNRAKYILDITWYIPEDKFVKSLIKMSNRYWMKVTAQAITNILEKETYKIWSIEQIHLRAWRIREIKDEQI